jgi:GntR family transcriptional repressor for pyruvate dehydrogenase complex
VGSPTTRRPLKVAEVVARNILDDVLARHLPAGTLLDPEAAMAQRFGVGRASLREALRILEVQGLLVIKPGPGGGPVVSDVSSHAYARTSSFYFKATGITLRDLIRTKVVLEPVLARLAAGRCTPGDVGRLERVLEAEQRELDDEPERWGPSPSDFHSLVASLSGDPVLDLFTTSIVEIQTDWLLRRPPLHDMAGVLGIHRQIAEAIATGDAESAERHTRRHAEDQLCAYDQILPEELATVVPWI